MYKIWKTLLLCLLCAALLLSCAACGDFSERSSSKKKRSDKDSDIFDSGYDPNYIVPGGKQLPDDVYIRDALPFSEGLAFVYLQDDYNTTYCINKKGEIVFQLDGQYTPCTEFTNGRTVLGADEKYFICDTSGNLTSLDDIGARLGATRIEVDRGELLDNGYFFLIKTQTDYTGSSDQVALVNFDGEIVIDYNDNLLNGYVARACDYYNGFICDYDYCWDLSDGTCYDSSAFYDVVPIEYQSDFWYHGTVYNHYIDERTGEYVLDLEQYDNIELSEFQYGYAPVKFEARESGGNYKYYFTVLKENGDFYFEPIQIDYEFTILRDKNSFVLYQHSHDTITVLDTKGLVSPATFDNKGGLIYRDGILLTDVARPVYYDLDGKLLFPQKID